MWRKLFLLSSLLASTAAHADMRHYVASIDNSQWQIGENTPISCRLEHEIPDYGTAVFSSKSGKDLNLLFTLDMWMKPDVATNAKLISRAPSWRPGDTSRDITLVKYHRQFNGEVPKKEAWTMLNELSKGREPTFYYSDWYDASNIAVGISSVNFPSKYREFRTCLSRLLPYSFEDIAFTVLNYEAGGTELTRFSKHQLRKVQEYLTYDQDIELVLVDAYTDSYGSRSANQKVSEKRADSVRDLLVAGGIEKRRIVTSGHGERRHVTGNGIEQEREVNRRVVIKITKPI